jgi:LysM repeat protein
MPRPQVARAAPVTIARAALLAAVALGVGVVLWRMRPSTTLATGSPDAGIVVGCEWLAWTLAAYLAFVVSLISLAHLSQACGMATSSLRRIAPARLRRVVDAAISVGLAGAIVGSVAATPAGAATTMNAVSRAPTVAGSPFDWPGLSIATAPARHHAHPPVHRTAPPVHRTPPPVHRPSQAGGFVVVQPGDTLWSIAARRLGVEASGAAITTAWHAWYAANRSTIGPDPSLIRPGQRLATPATATVGDRAGSR